MSGVIQGGWEYVQASYLLTGVVFAAYTFSLMRRLSAARQGAAARAKRGSGGSTTGRSS